MPIDPSNEAQVQREAMIAVSGIEVLGHHGALEHERAHGIRLRVDVEVAGDFAGVDTDALEDTLDYRRLEHTVRTVNRCSQFNLIESFANAIAGDVLSLDPRLTAVTVRVAKLNPPGMAAGVTPTVRVTRERA